MDHRQLTQQGSGRVKPGRPGHTKRSKQQTTESVCDGRRASNVAPAPERSASQNGALAKSRALAEWCQSKQHIDKSRATVRTVCQLKEARALANAASKMERLQTREALAEVKQSKMLTDGSPAQGGLLTVCPGRCSENRAISISEWLCRKNHTEMPIRRLLEGRGLKNAQSASNIGQLR